LNEPYGRHDEALAERRESSPATVIDRYDDVKASIALPVPDREGLELVGDSGWTGDVLGFRVGEEAVAELIP
jgi:hypothetical protein